MVDTYVFHFIQQLCGHTHAYMSVTLMNVHCKLLSL